MRTREVAAAEEDAAKFFNVILFVGITSSQSEESSVQCGVGDWEQNSTRPRNFVACEYGVLRVDMHLAYVKKQVKRYYGEGDGREHTTHGPFLHDLSRHTYK